MESRGRPLPSYDHDVSVLFFLLSLVVFGTLGLAVVFYAEHFLFWQHAFSDLGNTVTEQGYPNFPSRAIFSVGMILASFLMLRISAHYAEKRDLRNRTVKRWLAFLGAIGFLILIVPNNLNHFVHSVGAGMAIGVLYLFTMIFHFELRPVISALLFYTNLVVLQVAVFSYAVTFFADWAIKQSLQKVCFFGMFFALERIVTITEEGFLPSDMLGFLRRFQH